MLLLQSNCTLKYIASSDNRDFTLAETCLPKMASIPAAWRGGRWATGLCIPLAFWPALHWTCQKGMSVEDCREEPPGQRSRCFCWTLHSMQCPLLNKDRAPRLQFHNLWTHIKKWKLGQTHAADKCELLLIIHVYIACLYGNIVRSCKANSQHTQSTFGVQTIGVLT